MSWTFCEFFAGGGMARAGLGPRWTCVFANDLDVKKSSSYAANWGDEVLLTKDVRHISTQDVPGLPNLIWASFPCQDLSLAGSGAGLGGDRSGTFWPFWNLLKQVQQEGRRPDLLVLENVCGTLTSHGGKDFTAIAHALADSNYRFGAVVIDAVEFLPQSRPRLFIIAAASHCLPQNLVSKEPSLPWHTPALQLAYGRLGDRVRKAWVWWNLPATKTRKVQLEDAIEKTPSSVAWHTAEETSRLLSMMSPANLAKVRAEQRKKAPRIATAYRRTRVDEQGRKVQRAEVRVDGVAGCLRTPAGGSSRQIIFVISEKEVRSRLISSRETARLMGLPDGYVLPENYNDAYHLTGDGVVVPVVRFIAEHLLEPILLSAPLRRETVSPPKAGQSPASLVKRDLVYFNRGSKRRRVGGAETKSARGKPRTA